MSTDGSMHAKQPARGILVGAYLSWYIGRFQSGNS
jgi:hypothetical protein